MLACFCQLWQRCALKPFAANKPALFWVMTCLSLSAWVLADPPPNLSSVRNGCSPPFVRCPIYHGISWPSSVAFCLSHFLLFNAGTTATKSFRAQSYEKNLVHVEFSVINFLVSAETLMDLLKCSVTELDGEKMSWWIEVFVSWCTLYVLDVTVWHA